MNSMTEINVFNDFIWNTYFRTSYEKNSMDIMESGAPRRYKTLRGRKKHTVKIDMTPMVDLGFLLISFFVITTELSKPYAMDLAMPKDGPPMDLGNSFALTVLEGKDNSLYYYSGSWPDAVKAGQVKRSGYSAQGLRQIIREKQIALDASGKPGGRNELMLLFKASPEATYKNLVDGLDEAVIGMVKKYAVLQITPEEQAWLSKQGS